MNVKNTVRITTLGAMERIVRKRYNLVWDGYDVLLTRRHPAAYYYKDGRYINGKWYRTVRFPLTSDGWDIFDELRLA